jgi:hypothetical protein
MVQMSGMLMQMLKAQAVGSFTDDDIGNSANDGYNY